MIKKILPSIFKVSLLGVLLIALNQKVVAQTATVNYYPTGSSGNIIAGQSTYHASESVYTETEIGAGNFITMGTAINRISFLLNSTTATVLPVTLTGYKIYMKNVPASDSIFATGTYSLTGYSQVFDGSVTISSKTDWTPINLTTPFVRTAGSNIKILVLRTAALPTGGTGLVFIPSVGFMDYAGSVTSLSSRRYNSTVAPAAGSTSLTQTSFRPAIQFINTPALDAKPSSYTLPSQSCFATPQTIKVAITNSGAATAIAAGAVTVTLNVTGANTATLTQTSGAAIAVGATQEVTFSNINLNNSGTNNLEAIVTMTGDGDASNDTLWSGVNTLPYISAFPANESAETNPLTVFPWIKLVTGTRQLWGIRAGMNNADLSDSIPPIDGGVMYVYDNYSGASSVGNTVRLYSNCFTLPGGMPASNYKLNFWLTHDTSFAADLDSMYVSVTTDRGVNWTRIGGYQRYDAAYTTADWRQDSLSLSAYAGQTIQIGFEGVSKYGNVFGLDNITVTANYPLPITLSTFTGTREGSKNILYWTTTNELNNKGFELQRSVNGKEFSTINFVNSKATNGSSSAVLNYSYSDERPLAGTNYYRLRQLDINGKESYSSVVALKSAQITRAEISSVYPNPVQEKLNIVLNTPASEKVNVRITDLVGKTISTKTIETTQGDNNIQFNTTQLAKGTYLIKVYSSSNSEMATQKFVKQ